MKISGTIKLFGKKTIGIAAYSIFIIFIIFYNPSIASTIYSIS